MIFGEGPIIKNIAGDLNKLFLQGTRAGQPINNVEGDAAADQGTVQLMADRDPVIRDISTGLGWAGREVTVSGTGALQLVNSLGRPLKSWSVELAPFQEGSGDPSPENVRPIYGTNKLTIYTDSKYGRLVEWNQILRPLNTLYWSFISGTTGTIENGEAVITELTSTWKGIATANVTVYAGHKYLLMIDARTLNAGESVVISTGALRPYPSLNVSSTTYARYSAIVETLDDLTNVTMTIANRNNTNPFAVKNIQLFDLTKMFGAGNEPATVEEFRALFPNEYYPYNAGQQMTVDLVNGAQYSPVVITLPQAVYNGTVGSDGGEIRWGEVDLGTLNWSYTSGANRFDGTTITNLSANRTACICEAYKTANVDLGWDNLDYVCCIYSNRYTLFVKDTRFVNTADFKSAVSGVKLVYEFAIPNELAAVSNLIPTNEGDIYIWVTAEDGIVTNFSATYLQSE